MLGLRRTYSKPLCRSLGLPFRESTISKSFCGNTRSSFRPLVCSETNMTALHQRFTEVGNETKMQLSWPIGVRYLIIFIYRPNLGTQAWVTCYISVGSPSHSEPFTHYFVPKQRTKTHFVSLDLLIYFLGNQPKRLISTTGQSLSRSTGRSKTRNSLVT